MKTKNVFILQIISIGFCILLSITMFSSIENRLIEALNITRKNGFIITIIGLISMVVIYFVEIQESGKKSPDDLFCGSFFFFSAIVINLMDAHIVSTIFYWIIRLTLGNVFRYINYAVYVWDAEWALKIGLGVFLITFLLAAYIGATYAMMLPKFPVFGVLGFGGFMLLIIAGVTLDGAENTESTKSNSGGIDILDAYIALEEDRTRADIKRTADELENIRWELSKK